MGVHAIDAIARIVGPIERVSAYLNHRVYSYEAEDSATLLLRFACGAHGVVQSHYNCYQNALEIQGSAGRIWSSAWWGRDFAGDLHLQRGSEVTEFTLPQVNVYVPQIEHVSACVQTGDTPAISGQRGRANIAVIRAALESARSGAAVAVAHA
jgi:predicted dehydrogenase